MKAIHIKVYGKVQGVFYRANTQMMANNLSINGWIKNEEDGTVEAVLQGKEKDLITMLAYCKDNPGYSKVTDIKAKWLELSEKYTEFKME